MVLRCTSFNQGGRDYAKSLGITTKTDKIDCSIISRYINNTDMRVTPLTVSNGNIDCLKQKLSRRNQLVEIAKIQKTQIQQVTDTSIIKQIEELLAILRNQIKTLEDEMITFIDQNQELKRKYISITIYSSFHRSPDMIRLRIDGDKEVGCRQHIVMI